MGYIRHYFPHSVIKGMLSGIGIVIILKQIPHLLGYNSTPKGDFSYLQADGQTTLNQLSYMLESFSGGAIVISLCAIILLILWGGSLKKYTITKIIPGSLLAIVISVCMTLFFKEMGILALIKINL